MSPQNKQAIDLFCAYAPQDERFYQELAAHFSSLSSQGLCTLRHAGEITAGSEWEQTLFALIDQSELVLVFLSSDYFISLFHTNVTLQELFLRKAKQGRLIPLLLRPCLWQNSPLGTLTPLPRNGSMVSSHAQRDAIWLSIVKDLGLFIASLTIPTASNDPASRTVKENGNIWFVPYQRNPFFTGRDELILALHQRLQTGGVSEQTRMLAISGLGGIGKTQLVLEYAYRYRQNYNAILWVTAETPEILLADFTRLGEQLGFSTYVGQEPGKLASLVKTWLNLHHNWLLIFDNIDVIELINAYLPAKSTGKGHILFTTRATSVGGFAEVMNIEEMRSVEGELLLLRRAGVLTGETLLEKVNTQVRASATQIVSELDGLPLGIDQAGAYIAETGCSLNHYLNLFHHCRTRLLAQRGKLPPGHPEAVATTWTLSFQQCEGTPAADLLRLCAFLSPDSIPETIFLKGALVSSRKLARLATDPLALDSALATLRNYGLIKRNADNGTISLHRLVQTVLRDTLKPAQQRMWAERAIRALNKAIPEPDIALWQAWQPYLPQVFACVQLIDEYNICSIEAGALVNQTGTMLRHYARYSEAEQMYEGAMRIYEQLLGPEHPDTALVLANQATLLGIQRKYEQAAHVYERALSILEQALGPEHPDTAGIMNGLALLYSNWHRYDLSQQFYEKALGIRETMLGLEHPDTATTLDNLAMLYRQQGNYSQAEPLFKRALHIREVALGPEHATTASTLNNLAVLYRLQGNYQLARPLFERALQIREHTLGPEHPATATAISNLAYLARLQGQYEQALQLYQQALQIREHAFGFEHPNTTITCLNIGELYQEMGEDKQAEPVIRRALLTHEQVLGKDHPRLITILEAYSKLLHHLGREEEAMHFEGRAQAIRER